VQKNVQHYGKERKKKTILKPKEKDKQKWPWGNYREGSCQTMGLESASGGRKENKLSGGKERDDY